MDNIEREIIKRARATLSNPTSWTKLRGARDSQGNACPPTSADARCWCLLSALQLSALRLGVAGDQPEPLQNAVLGVVNTIPKNLLPHDVVTPWVVLQRFNDNPAVSYDMLVGVLDTILARTMPVNNPHADTLE